MILDVLCIICLSYGKPRCRFAWSYKMSKNTRNNSKIFVAQIQQLLHLHNKSNVYIPSTFDFKILTPKVAVFRFETQGNYLGPNGSIFINGVCTLVKCLIGLPCIFFHINKQVDCNLGTKIQILTKRKSINALICFCNICDQSEQQPNNVGSPSVCCEYFL